MDYTKRYKLKKPQADDYYNINDFNQNSDGIDDALSSVGAVTDDAYGVEIDFTTGTITRLGAAKGLTAGSDFDDISPWQRKKCIIPVNMEEPLFYEDDDGYTESGLLDESDEHSGIGRIASVYVEQKPLWYKIVPLKVADDALGTVLVMRIYISPTPKIGFILPAEFGTDDNGKALPSYRCAYEPGLCNISGEEPQMQYMIDTEEAVNIQENIMVSVNGLGPLTSARTFTDDSEKEYGSEFAFKYMRTGYEFTEESYFLTQMLYLVEYASFETEGTSYRGETGIFGTHAIWCGKEGVSTLESGYITGFSYLMGKFYPAASSENMGIIPDTVAVNAEYSTKILHSGRNRGLFGITFSNTEHTVRFMLRKPKYVGKTQMLYDRLTGKLLTEDAEEEIEMITTGEITISDGEKGVNFHTTPYEDVITFATQNDTASISFDNDGTMTFYAPKVQVASSDGIHIKNTEIDGADIVIDADNENGILEAQTENGEDVIIRGVAMPQTSTDAVNKDYVDSRVRFFKNVVVARPLFVADSTYNDYPYKAMFTCPGVRENMMPLVVFNPNDAGRFAPIAATSLNTVTIYAKIIPDNDITIPVIRVEVTS